MSHINDPRKAERSGAKLHALYCPEQGRTRQEGAADADINNIVNRWLKTGTVPMVRRGQPLFGDFTEGQDLQDTMDRVLLAQAEFEKLPARVRRLVDNDPAQFLDALNSEEGRELLQAGGLKIKMEPEGSGESPPPDPKDPPSKASDPVPADPPASEE